MADWSSGDARIWTAIMNNRDEHDHWMSRIGIKYNSAILMSRFSRRDVVVKDIAQEISERYQPDYLVGIDRCDSKRSTSLDLHRLTFGMLIFTSVASQMITTFEEQRNIEATKCL